MSADAKLWQDDEGRWHSVNNWDDEPGLGSPYDFIKLLTDIEAKAGCPLHWEIYQYAGGHCIRGYVTK